MYEIRHSSGDIAEAPSLKGALLAAQTLITDNDGVGRSSVYSGGKQICSFSKEGDGWRGWWMEGAKE
jgi:hypothetical protein